MNQEALSKLPLKERQRLQHEALMEAESQIKEQSSRDEEDSGSGSSELAEFDEAPSELESWDKTEQFTKYMEKNMQKAE